MLHPMMHPGRQSEPLRLPSLEGVPYHALRPNAAPAGAERGSQPSNTVAIPYSPRNCFLPAHKLLEDPKTRMIALTCGRRLGKTTFGVFALVSGAMSRQGNYAFVGPRRNAAKAVGWPMIKAMLRDVPGCEWRESELSVTVPCAQGGVSKIGIYSSSDDDSGSGVRGLELRGIYADEIAQQGADDFWSALWPTQNNVTGAWCIAAGTPRGIDLLHDLHTACADTPGWYSIVIPASESGVYDPLELKQLRNTMGAQRYYREIEARFDQGTDTQLIGVQYVIAAQGRTVSEARRQELRTLYPVVIGVDCALKADESVICIRCGPVMLGYIRLEQPETRELAYRIVAAAEQYKAAACFIDAGNVGLAVIDTVRDLGLTIAQGVDFGGRADDPDRYVNKKAEMYDRARQNVERHDCVLPPDGYVTKQLSISEFEINTQSKLVIESKKSLRKRLNASPDLMDAYATTFARVNVPNPSLVDLDGPGMRSSPGSGNRVERVREPDGTISRYYSSPDAPGNNRNRSSDPEEREWEAFFAWRDRDEPIYGGEGTNGRRFNW